MIPPDQLELENPSMNGDKLRDCFSRLVEPSTVMSDERLARWFATGQHAARN